MACRLGRAMLSTVLVVSAEVGTFAGEGADLEAFSSPVCQRVPVRWPAHAGNSSHMLSSSAHLSLALVDLSAHSESAAVLEKVFDLVGAARQAFIEILTQDDRRSEASSGNWLQHKGWCGLTLRSWQEPSPTATRQAGVWHVDVAKDFPKLLEKATLRIPDVEIKTVDLLRIAAGDASYYLWEALGLEMRPRVVVADADPLVEPAVFSTSTDLGQKSQQQRLPGISSQPIRSATSMRAIHGLGREKGYRLVHISHTGNMVFIRADIIKELHFAHGVLFHHIDDVAYFWHHGQSVRGGA